MQYCVSWASYYASFLTVISWWRCFFCACKPTEASEKERFPYPPADATKKMFNCYRANTAVIVFAVCLMHSTNAHAADIPLFLPYPKLDTGRWYVSHGWLNGQIQGCEWRKEAVTAHEGNLMLTVSNKGGKVSSISCAELHTKPLTGFGSYSVRMRAAKGSGLNTAFFTFVGPGTGGKQHDEIDFEVLGKNTRMVQLNYYINGKPQGENMVRLDYDAAEEFHDYTFVWQRDKIKWFIDNKLVHETLDGAAIPQNPGRIYLSLWAGSAKANAWLGPFAYTEDVTAEFSGVKYTPLNE